MMELAAIYKQRSVECERRAAEAKEEPDKEAWRSRAARQTHRHDSTVTPQNGASCRAGSAAE